MKARQFFWLLIFLPTFVACDSQDNDLLISSQRRQLEQELSHERMLRMGLQAYIDSILSKDTMAIMRRLEVYMQAVPRVQKTSPTQTQRVLQDSSKHLGLAQALENGLQAWKGEGMSMKKLRDKVVIDFQEKIFFEGEGAQLSDIGQDNAVTLAQVLKPWNTYNLTIEGHISRNSPKEDQNPWLRSIVRATALSLALRNAGIESERLRVKGRGTEVPIAPDSTAAGRYLNRRISVIISPQ